MYAQVLPQGHIINEIELYVTPILGLQRKCNATRRFCILKCWLPSENAPVPSIYLHRIHVQFQFEHENALCNAIDYFQPNSSVI